MEIYSLSTRLWKYEGPSAWYFLTVPKEESTRIKKTQIGKPRKGWGSVPVEVRIGTATWKTSIFPEKSGTYLLPVKASIRKSEGLHEDDVVRYTVHVV